jgi:exodeoxyribonuclease VII large subunit
MNPVSLFDLNEYIRRVITLNFRDPIWIWAEVGSCKNSRGHYYLDLVQKGESDLVAQSTAVLWAGQYRKLRQEHGAVLDEVLRDGVEIKLQVRVDFHERFGFKLLIEDIEPAYTFGKLEMQRRETIETLRREGLLERNRALPLRVAIQRIAVISSEGAAGWQDFRQHLAQNPFGYAFSCRLFTSALQGPQTAQELPAALAEVAARRSEFDVVAIIRGGGARTDLAAFDHPQAARAVALAPLPVLTGIGHDCDETVCDLVSHKSLKTPTAVADFLIQHNLIYENSILQLADQIRTTGAYLAKNQSLQLESQAAQIHWSARARVQNGRLRLQQADAALPGLARQLLRKSALQLDQAAQLAAAADPVLVLQRGFSISLKNGKIVRSVQELQAGDLLETRLADGETRSVIADWGFRIGDI